MKRYFQVTVNFEGAEQFGEGVTGFLFIVEAADKDNAKMNALRKFGRLREKFPELKDATATVSPKNIVPWLPPI